MIINFFPLFISNTRREIIFNSACFSPVGTQGRRFEYTFTGKKLQNHDLSSVLHHEAMIRGSKEKNCL